MSLFGNFCSGQLTVMQENFEDNEVAHRDSFCSYSALKKVSDGMIGTSKHDPELFARNVPCR